MSTSIHQIHPAMHMNMTHADHLATAANQGNICNIGLANAAVPCQPYRPLPLLLPSTKLLVKKLRRQMGDYAFVRYCRNLGIPGADCYLFMFGKYPTKPFEDL